jgi:hypothetical protein
MSALLAPAEIRSRLTSLGARARGRIRLLSAAAAAGVLLGVTLAGLLSPAAATAFSCTIDWSGGSGAAWETQANWTPVTGVARVPDSSDNVCIEANGTYTVMISSAAEAATLTIEAANSMGTQTLQITNGSSLTLSDDGSMVGANGAVTLDDTSGAGVSLDVSAGTLTNAGTITTQNAPANYSATLEGSITNTGSIDIDTPTVWSNNTVATLDNEGTLAIASTASLTTPSQVTFEQTAGSTAIASGSQLEVDDGALELQGGTLGGVGGWKVLGDVDNTGGNLIAGDPSTGTSTITGTYTQGAGATLTVDVDGTTPGTTVDQLDVTQSTALGGTLALQTAGFSPTASSVGNIVLGATSSGATSGTFATVTGIFPTATAGYSISYQGNDVALTIVDANTLTVSHAGSGSGTVTSSPTAIDCGSTCSAEYYSSQDQQLTLTATPSADSDFTGWSGVAGCPGTGTCQVTLSSAQAVAATFNLVQFSLTVTLAGSGSGTVTSSPTGIDCGSTCSQQYTTGTVVTLTPTPAAGSTFSGWSGVCSGAGSCQITLGAASNATATFAPLPVGPPAPSVASPVIAVSTDVAPVTGSVLIELPGTTTFVPLSQAENIPMGSTINATTGTVQITVALPNGSTETGEFYDGEFVVTQNSSGRVFETLSGGSFAGCPVAGKANKHKKGVVELAAASKKGTTVVRQLWGNAHGDFTTKGRYGSAAVSGTIWLTQDRCDGTYFKVTKDTIVVTANAQPTKHHLIKQGRSYLAPAPGF